MAPTRVLDLYGGSGAIALDLAAAGAHVQLVESFAPAAAQAAAAARASSLHLEADCADVTAALRTLVARTARFDAAVVNPPRRGMSPGAREWLARLDPRIIAYVSCDPDTLARDLAHFARLGYEATKLQPVDMIPLTEQVETVAIIRRVAVPAPRILYEDDEILVVEKGPHEPTMPQRGYATSVVARTRLLRPGSNAVAIHPLDVDTSGPVLFVRNPENAAKWQGVLNAASQTSYLAFVRGMTSSKGAVGHDRRDDSEPLARRTRFRRLVALGGHSIVRVVPGRDQQHRVRRHLAAMGHPILGDDRYGHAPTNRYFEEKHGLDRSFWHCERLEFEDPRCRERRIVDAPLPGDLCAVVERAGGPVALATAVAR